MMLKLTKHASIRPGTNSEPIWIAAHRVISVVRCNGGSHIETDVDLKMVAESPEVVVAMLNEPFEQLNRMRAELERQIGEGSRKVFAFPPIEPPVMPSQCGGSTLGPITAYDGTGLRGIAQ